MFHDLARTRTHASAQTGLYASSRPGRLSVFWGDQVFIPSIMPSYTPAHHADILCALASMVTETEWEQRGYSKVSHRGRSTSRTKLAVTRFI